MSILKNVLYKLFFFLFKKIDIFIAFSYFIIFPVKGTQTLFNIHVILFWYIFCRIIVVLCEVAAFSSDMINDYNRKKTINNLNKFMMSLFTKCILSRNSFLKITAGYYREELEKSSSKLLLNPYYEKKVKLLNQYYNEYKKILEVSNNKTFRKLLNLKVYENDIDDINVFIDYFIAFKKPEFKIFISKIKKKVGENYFYTSMFLSNFSKDIDCNRYYNLNLKAEKIIDFLRILKEYDFDEYYKNLLTFHYQDIVNYSQNIEKALGLVVQSQKEINVEFLLLNKNTDSIFFIEKYSEELKILYDLVNKYESLSNIDNKKENLEKFLFELHNIYMEEKILIID